MSVSTPYALLAIWLCFVARGAFHAAMLPPWEGFDEYAHVAVIEHWLKYGSLPRLESPLPDEIARSLQSSPVPRNLLWIDGTRSYTEYWKSPARRTPAALPLLTIYEAQQPPLYYWMMWPAAWLARGWPLLSLVQLLRLLSVLLASLFIPLTFLLARTRVPPAAALLTAALAALLPGLEPDVCRVGNDALALPMFTLLLLSAVERRFLVTGVVLGLGLLTKATFLAAVPALALIWLGQRAGWRKPLLALGMAALLGGWWYGWAHAATGSWSGWMEAVPHPDQPPFLVEAARVHWLQAGDAVFRSFVWFGDWSFLTVKRWMYYLCGALLLLCWLPALPRYRTYLPELAILAMFLAAMAYNVVITHRNHGISASTGWYCCTLTPALILVVTAGALHSKGWLLALLAATFVLITLYGEMFLAIPYYYGALAYNPQGGLPALALHDAARVFKIVAARLPPLALGLWPLAIAAQAVLCGMVTAWCAKMRLSDAPLS